MPRSTSCVAPLLMRTAVGLSLLWCVQAEQASIYINAGGVSYIDSSGVKWSADKYYNKGETFNELYWIFDTNDRNLYRSNRYDAGDSEPHLTYEIPVENGSYEVKLHFAETYSGALSIGARVFDVDIEKLVAFPSLDIFDEAGGYTALIKETTAQVTDGSLTIEFIRQKEMPLVSAIEIHQLDATVQKAEDSPEGADGESPIPSAVPSFEPSTVPSSQPSPRPSTKKNKKKREKEGAEKVTGSQSQASAPTPTPSSFPSTLPSSVPSSLPSFKPSGMPSLSESEIPSALPTISLSFSPSGNPTSEVDRPLLTVKMSKPSSLPSREPSKRPSEAQSFGVQKLVLVNANLNKDLEGALDCIPINACTGSSLTEFNIRAEVFGDVDRVHFTLEGPITETHTDRRVPYSVFSDDGEGDYNGEELLQGNYTITATALNSDNESSDPYVKVFTVSSQDGFGITDLVFVDADTNEDIDGAMDCDPVDSCFGSASSVGMRAKVHGDVRSVFFTTEGPITQSRTESRAPWSVFGDIGDAIRGKEMVPGSYTVTARATNDDGDESDLFTRSFVVGSQSSSPRPSKKPASPPSLEPSWTPTELVEDAGSAVPSFDPSRSPSIVPSVSPSIEPSSTPSFLAEQGFKPIYINCGGSSFEDARGIIWEADKYFLSGAKSATSESIEGAVDSKLFQTERWDSSVSKRLAYEIPVPEGYRYRVSLLFSENYERLQKVGGRVFSVKLESDIVFSDLDIFAEAGGPFTALNKTATTFVSDGSLSIAFINNVQSPKVSGIEVHQLPETLSPVALGAGKPDSINMPSLAPSGEPSELPSGLPSNPPSVLPAEALSTESSSSGLPSQDPSATPSQLPSGQPSWDPMGKPSEGPSRVPVGIPTTIAPTRSPTLSPSQFPSTLPSLLPSGTPSGAPSKSPVVIPTTTAPTPQPTASPTPDPSSSPSGTPTLSPFGVNGFILVDADSGSDIEGALECSPASSCFGSASNFNIRATVFGSDVQGVELLLEGPVAEATIEKVAPYSIFGDKDGTFFGKALPVGAYTIRAFAFNSQGDVSNDYSLTFDVLETPSVSPSGQPSLIPTFRPTNSPTPAPIAPVVAPTTADPSSVPSSMPSSSPFGVDGFVLVDADRNQDIVDALMECDPIDDCVGSASKFNIRATVFGNSIKGVDITIVGPVKGTKREEVPPYAVFGDKNGDYNGTALPPGQYSITARAFNEEGKFSQNYTVTFNVANAPTQPPSGRPSQVPTPVPTGMPSPAPILPAPDPTASSTPSPTPKRTSFPSSAPTKLPTSRPTLSPSAQPSSSPTDSPSKGPTLAPITPVADPTLDPTSAPTPVPSHSPTEGPTGSPTESPTVVPLPQPTPSPTEDAVEQLQNPIRINAGGKAFTDSQGVEWASDAFFQGGKTYETTMPIVNTDKQELYRSERYSDSTTPGGLIYDIPVPNGSYLVSLHFADIFNGTHKIGARMFDVRIGGFGVFKELDIFSEVGGYAPLVKQAPAIVLDGSLTIDFVLVKENPKISAIEIEPLGSAKGHQAHAVCGGPYFETDTDEDGMASVAVDGSFSHTHGPGASLISFKWIIDGAVVGTKEIDMIQLPVGTYDLTLEVIDSDSDVSRDTTSIKVRPSVFPDIESLLPQTGNVAGGGIVSISGTGFTASAAETIVFFGQTPVTGDSKIAVINETTIQVQAPPLSSGTVQVRVATPVGDSNFVTYTYIDGMPISFKTGTILSGAYGVTCIATAPNGDLYIGTQTGTIIKLKLDDNYNIVSNTKSYVIANENSPLFRSILGITFDPMDLEGEAVYVSHSTLFHGQITDFYNGKVSRVSGDLNVVEDVVTGLPVSDLDHGVNGLVFDDNGNLYIQVGANTNAGVPGNLSSSGLQEDGVFSGATLMAHLNRLNFDGDITYDENGNQASGWDVEIFASGERNPFDITLHSNGYLYGTDNGPNYEFGKTSVDCKTEAPDPFEKDELNLLEKGGYYGSANRKRGQTDPRQCKWRSNTSPSDEEYTAPIALLESSTDGIIEFQSDHFFGQLRGNLILGRYKGGLYRAELSSDGRSVLRNPSMFNKNGGLTLTQGPDGTLFVVKNDEGKVIYLSPDESVASLGVDVKSVFPRRGPQEGGSLLTIYGDKLDALGRPTVTVGGKVCPLSGPVSTSKLTCRLPSGTGTVDIVVSSGEQSDTFERGYRYIRGTA